MTVAVLLSSDAQAEFLELPTPIKARVEAVFKRLKDWPNVSGAKPLRGPWAGHYRIRTGDWRLLFRVVPPNLLVVRIQHRREVYDE
jgi:mRNA-degrading endonuclease RelE of RelBE toxin-antitoxin system